MPWNETTPMDQKMQFIADYLRAELSMTELCELYGISRKTGYKFVERYLEHGPEGLEERSRRPQSHPNETPEEVVQAILELRRRHPRWGAKKLLPLLEKRHPRWELPGRTTVCDILSRHGMVPKQRNRRAIGHPGKPSSEILAPNDCWSADFKGQFKTGDGRYCYPLTVTDGLSRFLLGCQALHSTAAGRGQAGVHPPVQGVWAALAHAQRQRRAVCQHRARTPVAAVRLVGAPGHPARVDRAGQTAAKRSSRTHAPHSESRDHAAPG